MSWDDGRYHYSDAESGTACATAIGPGSDGDSVTLCFDISTMHVYGISTLPRGWYFRLGGTVITPDRYRTELGHGNVVSAAPLDISHVAALARATVDIGLCYRSRCQDISGIGPFASALLRYAIANSRQERASL